MTDIVRHLEQFSNSKGYIFHYGRKSVLNLLDFESPTHFVEETIYFLLENRTIRPQTNATKTNVKGNSFDGTFFLIKHSELDQEFKDKYIFNIEPLLSVLKELQQYFSCTLIDFEVLEADDVTDILDMNCDGLMVKFKAYIPE
jgi:hypothetical protein